jgi:CRISPR-associated protein Cas6
VSGDLEPHAAAVDLAFPLVGRHLPRDHADALGQALLQVLPWLAEEPLAGVHPVNLVHGATSGSAEGLALLSGRARLLLRLPLERAAQAGALAGRSLDVGGCSVAVGTPHERPLQALATLYAHAVAAQGDDEAHFADLVQAELDRLQIRSPWVCGKQGHRSAGGRRLTTFSLMLHSLSPQDSLRLQEQGLGGHRLLGCGIFVPHKSAAAVGE